jgi:hypothetical protein
VHRLAYNSDVVAFKMGRRQGGVGEASSLCFFRKKAKRGRFAYTSQPSGPRPVGCFSVRRPPDSLDLYQFRYGRFATASPARTALKNSQRIRRPAGRRHYYMRDGALGLHRRFNIVLIFGLISRESIRPGKLLPKQLAAGDFSQIYKICEKVKLRFLQGHDWPIINMLTSH